MQGPAYLDLARNLADEHHQHQSPGKTRPKGRSPKRRRSPRAAVGHMLIRMGERMMPRSDYKPQVSTGPPY
jgi:hypothetical protein